MRLFDQRVDVVDSQSRIHAACKTTYKREKMLVKKEYILRFKLLTKNWSLPWSWLNLRLWMPLAAIVTLVFGQQSEQFPRQSSELSSLFRENWCLATIWISNPWCINLYPVNKYLNVNTSIIYLQSTSASSYQRAWHRQKEREREREMRSIDRVPEDEKEIKLVLFIFRQDTVAW